MPLLKSGISLEGVQKVIRYHHAITEEERENLTTRDTWLLDIVSFANAVHNAAGTRSNRFLFRDYGSDLLASRRSQHHPAKENLRSGLYPSFGII